MPVFPPTTHDVLLELLRLGLAWHEARSLPAEEVLCLLYHSALQRDLHDLQTQAAGIASQPFADPHEQQRLLLRLQHHASAKLRQFYQAHKADSG